MINEILPIPTSFEELRLAALSRELVPFVGAGVSMLAGCPSWDELANNALLFYLSKRELSPAEYNQIKGLSSRIKLSLALDIQKKTRIPIDFGELLKPSKDKHQFGLSVYDRLGAIANKFITTNYDEFLDRGRTVFHQLQHISMENFDAENSVFHIHGSILDPKSMVLTTDEYLVRYANHEIHEGADGENPFLTFLGMLFKCKTILFVGYSLAELEVLEYVLQKSKVVELRHFILLGFFSHELPLVRHLESYFSTFGVRLIPFSRDERDWEQLAEVIDALAVYLPAGKPLGFSKLREMESLLS